jgi:outer membrane biosynthesis protein TonB
MRRGLAISLALHAAILIMALVVLPDPDEFKVKPQDAIQVDISQITDESKRKATVKAEAPPKPVEKPKPKPVEVAKDVAPAPKVAEEIKTAAKEAAAEPPPPEPPKKEVPKKAEVPKQEEPKPLDPDPLKDLIKDTVEEQPEPKPQEPKKAEEPKKEEPKKEQVRKAEVKPEPKPEKKAEKKPEKKKPKLDTDEIAAFLNKTDEERTAPQKPSPETGTPEQAEANVQGADDALAATLVDALRQRLAECWSVPPGAREAKIVVKVRFSLNQDGSVAGMPQVLNDSGDALFGVTAQSAISAVMECQLYDFLPREKYSLWRDITINFNPNMMFGT